MYTKKGRMKDQYKGKEGRIHVFASYLRDRKARKVRFGREEFLSGPTYFGPVIGHPQDRNI